MLSVVYVSLLLLNKAAQNFTLAVVRAFSWAILLLQKPTKSIISLPKKFMKNIFPITTYTKTIIHFIYLHILLFPDYFTHSNFLASVTPHSNIPFTPLHNSNTPTPITSDPSPSLSILIPLVYLYMGLLYCLHLTLVYLQMVIYCQHLFQVHLHLMTLFFMSTPCPLHHHIYPPHIHPKHTLPLYLTRPTLPLFLRKL